MFFKNTKSNGKKMEKVNNEKRDSESERALSALIIIMLAGLSGIVLYSLHTSSLSQFLLFTTVGIMTAAACLLSGGLLGFLFGIPRTLQRDRITSPNNSEKKSEKEDQGVDYLPNTNLEQISDWLTKILVGVGLTQIGQISEKFRSISKLVSAGLDNSPNSNIFALTIIIFFCICGFLFGYLWTRLYLLGAIRKADINALANRLEKANKDVEQVNMKLEELKNQAVTDANAISLVQRQLNPSFDIPPVKEEELTNAIKDASRPVKVQVFSQAQVIRSDNWRTNKSKMKLAVPIFKALIDADTLGEFHRNHAQLGYALKDQEKPEWAKAEEELSKAIDLRGPWQENGWLFYEYNRAICRINLDANFPEHPSTPEVRNKILDDIKAAYGSKLKKLILKEDIILKWMKKNNIDDTKL